MNTKNTICALLLGTSLFGCEYPAETRADGSKVLYVPAECKEIVSLSEDGFWQLTCKDDKGKELFFMTDKYHAWVKYEIVHQ